MTREATNQRAIWLATAALAGVVLFRANSGRAWLGMGLPKRLQDGSVVLPAARPVALGLALASGDPVAGQSDLIGWRTITITPDMVGCRVAVFTAIEVKREKGGRTSAAQTHWMEQVQRAGGIAGVANSPDAARKIVEGYRPLGPDLFAASQKQRV
jgi:hypothetical protein